jgi:hypothetical protein
MSDNGILKFFGVHDNSKGIKYGAANVNNYKALYAASEITKAEHDYWEAKDKERQGNR